MENKYLIIGCKGMLGSDLVAHLNEQRCDFTGVDVDILNITDRKSCLEYIKKLAPDIIINAAAYTDVEKSEIDRENAFKVNRDGVRNLAEAADLVNASFCHISTDYVFDGNKNGPYEESDGTNPLSIYGRSKLEGELEIKKTLKNYWIIRTSWLFGVNGKNFVKTIMNRAVVGSELKVISDQFGSPTYTVDLSKRIIEVIERGPFGIYHVTNSGSCSWFQFADTILNKAGLFCRLKPILTDAWPSKVIRPKNSILANKATAVLGMSDMPSWEDALSRYLKK